MEVSALISHKSERFVLSQWRAAAGHECSGSTGGAGGWQPLRYNGGKPQVVDVSGERAESGR